MAAVRLLIVVLIVSFLSSLPLIAQTTHAADPCAMPSFPKLEKEANMFSEEQEEWLGEIMEQSVRREFHVLEDPEGRLQQLGERLLAQLPPTKLHYRFVIVDSPEINSFGIAGGRIFIFRRVIAFAQSEDELAALLGHEIGHIVTHQPAIDVTRWFRDLGINQVGDRQDLLKKWNQLRDNVARIRDHGSEEREEQGQLVADRVALYAMARAGYDPARGVDFFDRVFLTKGKTGGFWSDFFGHTRPENKRLRELVRNAGSMPANCITTVPTTRNTFLQWRDEVIASKRAVTKEDVGGLLTKTTLHPSLRGDLDQAQFSSDGRHILAQDENGIFVLGRDPLTNLFRIDAPDAYPAHFTPDSTSIVFYDKEFRVEKWDIETRQRASVHELNPSSCWGSDLSPTGEVLACVRPQLEMASPSFELQLIDVATGKAIFSREKFYELSRFELFVLYLLLALEDNPSLFSVQFSPDGHYVLVTHGTTAFAYDLKQHSEIKMPGSFKDAIASSFTFIAPDELEGFNGIKGKMARIQFPSGHIDEEFPFNKIRLTLSPVDKGNYVVVHGSSKFPVVLLDLSQKKLTMAYKVPAFALYDPFYAGEELTGQIVLGKLPESKPIAQVSLPDSPLGKVNVGEFSPDGKWLAVSGHSRGAVWNLQNGERVLHMPNFDGAFFDSSGQLFMKLPAKEDVAERVFQADPNSKETKKLFDLSPAPNNEKDQVGSILYDTRSHITQSGEFLLKLTPKNASWSNRDYDLEVRDVRTNNLLWEHKFARERPNLYYSRTGNTFTLVLKNSSNIKDAIKNSASLQAKLSSMDAKKEAYLIQSFDASTGRLLGGVLVDTGKLSFTVGQAMTVGDTVVVEDSENRTLVYSLQSGEQRGKVFGRFRALSAKGDKLLVENEAGVAEVYETSTLQPVHHFVLPSRIVHADFTADGASILLLTADQIVYKMEAAGQAQTAQTH